MEARPRVNDRARVGQASMHEPQAMQSPARTIASHPSSAGSRIAGSDRHASVSYTHLDVYKRQVRTRDPDLGKVVLYQLSHVRIGEEI